MTDKLIATSASHAPNPEAGLQSGQPQRRVCQSMEGLITEIRSTIPFDLTDAQMCQGICRGCSKKLLEFLDQELETHSQNLADGEIPTLGEIHKLGKLARKVHRVLEINDLV